MDPITVGIIGGAGAIISTLGGVISLVKEFLKTGTAERALRSTVRASISGESDDLSKEIERLLRSDPGSNAELVEKLTRLVSDVNISEGDRKALFSGLQQRSTAGQQRYAAKLFAEVNDSAKAPASE